MVGGNLCSLVGGGRRRQDALRESFPDMPREDRQLLMLRFVREVDQSVDYGEVRYCTIVTTSIFLDSIITPGR